MPASVIDRQQVEREREREGGGDGPNLRPSTDQASRSSDERFQALTPARPRDRLGDNSVAGDHAAGVGDPRLTPA
jgi:hypothetical protein